MSIRHYFDQQLDDLRDQILVMGSRVRAELDLALDALATLSTEKAQAVFVADQVVNEMRFKVEEQCFTLIVTQQPATGDMRSIVAAMSVIVDLERMGDQAKGIAKAIPRLVATPNQAHPPELQQMGELVGKMLNQVMIAFAHNNTDLARIIVRQDDEVDVLYVSAFNHVMGQMAQAGSPEKAEAAYELLRVARELERFGDFVINVGERIIYLETGTLEEINVDTK